MAEPLKFSLRTILAIMAAMAVLFAVSAPYIRALEPIEQQRLAEVVGLVLVGVMVGVAASILLMGASERVLCSVFNCRGKRLLFAVTPTSTLAGLVRKNWMHYEFAATSGMLINTIPMLCMLMRNARRYVFRLTDQLNFVAPSFAPPKSLIVLPAIVISASLLFFFLRLKSAIRVCEGSLFVVGMEIPYDSIEEWEIHETDVIIKKASRFVPIRFACTPADAEKIRAVLVERAPVTIATSSEPVD